MLWNKGSKELEWNKVKEKLSAMYLNEINVWSNYYVICWGNAHQKFQIKNREKVDGMDTEE